MRRWNVLLAGAALTTLVFVPAAAQVRVEVPAASGQINVKFSERADEGQADRLRDLAARLKPIADQLENLDRIDIVIIHSEREFKRDLGGTGEGRLAAVSYVRGILFFSPLSWQRNPTDEALEYEMEEALVRYVANRMAGGNRLPDWLTDGLVRVLAKRPAAPATAELVAQRAPLLLAQFDADDPNVGYWAVRYLVEARGGLTAIRQLLRLTSQRPDTFVENLQLVYGVPVGELEGDWRGWLERLVEEDKRRREGGVQEGPLIKQQNRD
jgi:hypothetical protein